MRLSYLRRVDDTSLLIVEPNRNDGCWRDDHSNRVQHLALVWLGKVALTQFYDAANPAAETEDSRQQEEHHDKKFYYREIFSLQHV
jgi:hypothetical protein